MGCPELPHFMFYETIRRFPEQLLKGWQLGSCLEKKPRSFRCIYYSGMGGSSFPANLVNDFLHSSPPLQVVRDYQLPVNSCEEDLVISASFSGNTEETLDVFHESIERKLNIVALANGGKLMQLAKSKGVDFLQIPDCLQPRLAAGYYFSCILGILYKLGYIESRENELEALVDFLRRKQADFEALGRKTAKGLIGFVPMIYGPSHLESTMRVWKIKFNENAKIHSFYNSFPELNHNEMEGFSNLILNPAIIYLISRKSHARISKRMEVMQQVLSKVPFYPISLCGEGHLQEMFESLAISDYTSYYLAKHYGVDPEKVEMIENFKAKMNKTECFEKR